jgi:predicted nucleotide-binding protein
MSLPIRTVLDDVTTVCAYLAKKPTGATVAEARKVLDSKYLDGRKMAALKTWGLVEEQADRLRLSSDGRTLLKDAASLKRVMLSIVRRNPPYNAVIERAAHRREESASATDVASHWHQHFTADVADSDKILNDQAVCFFQVASGAGLGQIVIGRRGSSTRFQFDQQALSEYLDGSDVRDVADYVIRDAAAGQQADETDDEAARPAARAAAAGPHQNKELGQAIFVAHGKSRKALEQLKNILDQFKIPYKVATEEPNLGRPIGTKVREVMEACNCAILIFTADEEFKDIDGKQIWRPSENVVFELGAAGYLYGNRIVIMKEDTVTFPANFRDLGHISFSKDSLDAKAMDVLKELIGFGIVRVST